MNAFSTIKNIYFLGIGGIGMSALAQFFMLDGKQVAGYDKTPGKMTKKLKAVGIRLISKDSPLEIPAAFLNPSDTLVVYTPAIPSDLKILVYFKENGFRIEKRAEVLGKITSEMPTLAIAGTHGKTTTTAILAHLLKQSGFKITAFMGGISENYQSNFIGDGKDAVVVEADEFDRSFLKLSPTMAGITAMAPDHLDIYGSPEELIASFHQFAEKLDSPNKLFFTKGLDLEGHSIALNEEADYIIQNISLENGSYRFDLKTQENTLTGLQFDLPGHYNLLNAGMALAMALRFGADAKKLSNALASFRGVDRRFTYHLKTDKIVLIEDYAHHPDEIAAVYGATRERYPGKNIGVVFQPHLYSRTRDFADGFARSLEGFDTVFLLPIYPAREKPIPGINSAYLLGLIDNPHKKCIEKNEIAEMLNNSGSEVVLLLGAGDIGEEVETIKKALSDEN